MHGQGKRATAKASAREKAIARAMARKRALPVWKTCQDDAKVRSKIKPCILVVGEVKKNKMQRSRF